MSEGFGVAVGLHQGSALSPYLFILVMDALLKGNIPGVPWCMLFADDMVLICETVEEVERWLGRIVRVLEGKGQ